MFVNIVVVHVIVAFCLSVCVSCKLFFMHVLAVTVVQCYACMCCSISFFFQLTKPEAQPTPIEMLACAFVFFVVIGASAELRLLEGAEQGGGAEPGG